MDLYEDAAPDFAPGESSPACAQRTNLTYYVRIFRKIILTAALMRDGAGGDHMNKVIAAACGAWCLIGIASAQNYPVKTVRIIVPYPAGGTSDILARLLSAKLNDVFG